MYWCSLPWQMCTTFATCCMLLLTRLYRTCEKCTKCAESWTTCVQWQWCGEALPEFYYGRQASFSAQQLCTTAQFPFRSVIQTLCAGRSRIRMTLFVPTFGMPPFHSQLSSMCRIAELLLSGVSVLVAELQSHRTLIELYPTKMSVSYVAKYFKK